MKKYSKGNKKKAVCVVAGAILAAACAAFPVRAIEKRYTADRVAVEEISLAAAVLRQGSKGSDVKEVQRRLKQWGYYDGSVDGVFGAGTKAAVVAFQKKNGLKADGIVGKATYQALGMNSNANALSGSSGNSKYTSSDLYLIAKAIHAEGRGEPYTGQVAIGAVIINRIKSPSFPNTVAGVVYQKNAFTAVNDGQINLEPNDTAMRAA
ncbi:MAG: peptidoglycan-binding protein, partial [Clostridia bacterium]|nr:peptidoglycan-binding protein [Clostridia bacterium]